MLGYKNNSDTLIVVLHEIYGINRHIQSVCENFNKNGYDVVCPDLINRNQPYESNQEKEAYQNFKVIGIETAFQKVKALLTQLRHDYKNITILGYSIGATIAWLCSNEAGLCDGVAGLYGSRIRDYIDIAPQCPTLLIFAAKEEAFNVTELVALLRKKDIEIHILEGRHGFCNQSGVNYNADSCRESTELVDDFIKRLI